MGRLGVGRGEWGLTQNSYKQFCFASALKYKFTKKHYKYGKVKIPIYSPSTYLLSSRITLEEYKKGGKREKKEKKKRSVPKECHQDISLIYHTGTPNSEIFIISLCNLSLCCFRSDAIEAT